MKRLLAALAFFSLLAGCASHESNPPPGYSHETSPPSPSYDKTGIASYYGARHQGKRTANGETFNYHALTAAHLQLPFGTRVKVTNLTNDKSVIVRINDRGPHIRGRLIDLSRSAAAQLGMLKCGIARVRIQSLDY